MFTFTKNFAKIPYKYYNDLHFSPRKQPNTQLPLQTITPTNTQDKKQQQKQNNNKKNLLLRIMKVVGITAIINTTNTTKLNEFKTATKTTTTKT